MAGQRKLRELPWYIYVVANHDHREIYIGVVQDRGTLPNLVGPEESVGDRWREHCAGDTKALNRWVCQRDDMELLCIETAYDQRAAAAVAHDAERYPSSLLDLCEEAVMLVRDDDYAVILTSGI